MSKPKKVKQLEKRVEAAREELERLEAKLQAAREKAQHKQIDKLDDIVEETEHKVDDLKHLGRQVWRELKAIVRS